MMKGKYRMGIGAPSILTVFVVLILTTLGVLALTGARADMALTRRSVYMTQALYASSAQAERIIASIDGQLADMAKTASDEEDYRWRIQGLNSQEVALYVEGMHIFFDVPVTERQTISVELELFEKGAYPRYRVASFVCGTPGEWDEATSINLM